MAELTDEQKLGALFITLIQQFQMQAWISLGKLKNPVTDKIEKNMELARISIDMLDMLRHKTEGNRTDDEDRLLQQTISDLQLNYFNESDTEEKDSNNPGAITGE